jgi:hypothetical protein
VWALPASRANACRSGGHQNAPISRDDRTLASSKVIGVAEIRLMTLLLISIADRQKRLFAIKDPILKKDR